MSLFIAQASNNFATSRDAEKQCAGKRKLNRC